MIRFITKIVFILSVTFLTLNAAKETLDWGADTDANVPFVFPDPLNIDRLTGFEYDIVEELFKYLNVEGVLFRNEWNYLLEGLRNGEHGFYDIAVGGFSNSWKTTGIEQAMLTTTPHLVTYMRLTIRANDNSIKSLKDCIGKRVGSLSNSVPYKYLSSIEGIEAIPCYSEVYAYDDLKAGRIDAFFMDAPMADYYGKTDPDFKVLETDKDERIEFCIAVAKNRPDLVEKINEFIKIIIENGRLRTILERWNLWNPLMSEYTGDYSVSTQEPVEYNNYIQAVDKIKAGTLSDKFKIYLSFWPTILKAALITIKVSVLSMIVAIIVGLILALGRTYGPSFIRVPIIIFVEFLRGTPLLIQLLFIFYGLPHLGLSIPGELAGILGLGLNYAAFEAENYRAGLLSVPKGQMEAARALGMSQSQAIIHVIIPQAIRIVIPPLTNDFISLIKDSSLVSMVTIVELTSMYNQLGSTYQDYFGTGIIIAVLYLLLGLPFLHFAKWAERKLAIAYK